MQLAIKPQDLLTFSLIEKTPNVLGGSARIVRTRIPVWVLESCRRQGNTESEILANFPSIRAIDLVQAWLYIESHFEEINKDIQENEEA